MALRTCANLADHRVFDDAARKPGQLELRFVAEITIELRRLEAEGFQIERPAIARFGTSLELLDQSRADAVMAAGGIHPQLLKLAARTPASTHSATHDLPGRPASETG